MNFEVDTISAGSLSSDHLFVTLYTLSFYLSVYKHLIRALRTLSETHIVYCPLKFIWEKIAFTNNREEELETYEHITKYLLFGVNGRLNYLMLWKSCGALENPQISLAVSKAIQISILCEEKHRKIPNIYIYIYISYIFCGWKGDVASKWMSILCKDPSCQNLFILRVHWINCGLAALLD